MTATKPKIGGVKIGPLREPELAEAGRIVRLAFGTFLGIPDPLTFMGDRDLWTPRYRASNVKVLAARLEGRLIGISVATRWGAFGYFGPVVVLPEFWDKGVAQQLLAPTVKLLDRWGVRYSGLFTFAHSAKHVGLYQKFGYWPQRLTALMSHTPPEGAGAEPPILLSAMHRTEREQYILACAQLTGRIDKGLDLTGEIRSLLAQRGGDVVLVFTRSTLEGFALCFTGAGTEGGSTACYIKFGAARHGKAFDQLLAACDAFAAGRGVPIEAGMNLESEDAYRRMRAHGYRASNQGVLMLRPNKPGFNRPDTYVIADLR